MDALRTLCVHRNFNLLWQNILCDAYWLWWPDELTQLLLGCVKDKLHWLLNYQNLQNVNDQLHNQFTHVSWYPGLENFTEPFDSLKSCTWQSQYIRGGIRTQGVTFTPFLVSSDDDTNRVAETAANELVMVAVLALSGYSRLVSQQNHSDLSLKARDHVLKQCFQMHGACQTQKMSQCAMAKLKEQLEETPIRWENNRCNKFVLQWRSWSTWLKR